MNTNKLAKTCNTTRKIVKVLRIFLYVAIALFVVASVVMVLPVYKEQTATILVEDTLTGSEIAYTRNEVIAKGSWAVSVMAIGSVIMLLCEKILGTVSSESTPFVAANVKRLKAISILMACLSVVPGCLAQIVGLIMGIRSIMLNVELTMLVIALVVWCVALIFEYGVSLQEREDETL